MTTLPFGILTVLWTFAKVPTLWRSAAAGSSMRGSNCATTPKYLSSSVRELTKDSELSRPTVRGRIAPGNRTVSRTGRMGNVSGTGLCLSAIGSSVQPKSSQNPEGGERLDAKKERRVHSFACDLQKILVYNAKIIAPSV